MEMKDFSLEGKVALVTGASYGIGFAIAEGMAKAGATIVFNDIRQELVDKGLAADVYKRKVHSFCPSLTAPAGQYSTQRPQATQFSVFTFAT